MTLPSGVGHRSVAGSGRGHRGIVFREQRRPRGFGQGGERRADPQEARVAGVVVVQVELIGNTAETADFLQATDQPRLVTVEGAFDLGLGTAGHRHHHDHRGDTDDDADVYLTEEEEGNDIVPDPITCMLSPLKVLSFCSSFKLAC